MKKIFFRLQLLWMQGQLSWFNYRLKRTAQDIKALSKDIRSISNEVNSLDPAERVELARVMRMNEVELAAYERQAFNYTIRQRVVYFFRHGEFPNGWKITARSVYRVIWMLLICFTSLTASAQSPLIGQCHEYMYTLDEAALHLYNHETDQEQTFCLSPSEAYWDSNNIIAHNTPLFSTRGLYEPVWMVRWVTFYDATDQETGEVYQIIINYEWYNGQPRRITLIRISHLQYWE